MINSSISIIIPVYNCEDTIRGCIESILSQTYENFELLLINDGSSDNSGVICDQYKLKDDRIQVIHQKNHGVSYTRNLGIKHSTGKYIQFIDADDWIDKNMLYEMVINMNNSHDLVISGYKRLLVQNKEVYHRSIIISEITKSHNLVSFLQGFAEYYNLGIIQALWNKMYITDLIKKNNINFDQDLSLGEDLLFNIDYISNCKSIKVLNEAFYNYSVFLSGDSLSTKYNSKRIEAQIKMYDNIIALFKKNNVYTKQNKIYLDQIYSSSLIGAIKNYSTKSNDTYMKKKAYLKSIVNDKKIRENVKLFKNGGKIKDLFALLIKIKFTYGLILMDKFLIYTKFVNKRKLR